MGSFERIDMDCLIPKCSEFLEKDFDHRKES